MANTRFIDQLHEGIPNTASTLLLRETLQSAVCYPLKNDIQRLRQTLEGRGHQLSWYEEHLSHFLPLTPLMWFEYEEDKVPRDSAVPLTEREQVALLASGSRSRHGCLLAIEYDRWAVAHARKYQGRQLPEQLRWVIRAECFSTPVERKLGSWLDGSLENWSHGMVSIPIGSDGRIWWRNVLASSWRGSGAFSARRLAWSEDEEIPPVQEERDQEWLVSCLVPLCDLNLLSQGRLHLTQRVIGRSQTQGEVSSLDPVRVPVVRQSSEEERKPKEIRTPRDRARWYSATLARRALLQYRERWS